MNKNKNIYRKARKHKYHSMTDEQKQKDYQKEYRKNMTDEQKKEYRESGKQKYHNMTDEQKRKYIEAIKNHQKEYKKT